MCSITRYIFEKGDTTIEHEGSFVDQLSFRGENESIGVLNIFLISANEILYGLLVITMRAIGLPREAERLFPQNENVMLTAFLLILGVAQMGGYACGPMSDNSTSRFGRRRPILFVASLGVLLGLNLMWQSSQHMWAWGFVVGVAITYFGGGVAETMCHSLLNDKVSDEEIGMSSGINVSVIMFGSLAGFIYIQLFVGADLTPLYMLFIAITILQLIPYLFIPEVTTPLRYSGRVDVITSFKRILTDPLEADFRRVLLSRIGYQFGCAYSAFLMFYLRDQVSIDDPAERQWWVALNAVGGVVVGLVLVIPLGYLSDTKFAYRKYMVYASCALMIVANTVMMVVPFWSEQRVKTAMFAISGVIWGLGMPAFQAVDLALAMDTLSRPEETATCMGLRKN